MYNVANTEMMPVVQQICHFTAVGPFGAERVPAISRIPRTLARRSNGIFLDLARDSDNFPKKVLALFDKHFGFRRSIFFPYLFHGLSGPGPAGEHPEQPHLTSGMAPCMTTKITFTRMTSSAIPLCPHLEESG
ncbi:MAG: hypothetical protein ACLT9P_04145 [Evtepia gabavorous]